MMLIEVIVPMKLVFKPNIFIIKLFIFWIVKTFYFTEGFFGWVYSIINNVRSPVRFKKSGFI